MTVCLAGACTRPAEALRRRMRHMKLAIVAAALLLLTAVGVLPLRPPVASAFSSKSFTPPQAVPPSTIFRIETDEFWLNLHHFLYVVGRAQAKTGDANREAVADAPAEAERGLRTLTAEEHRTWRDAVTSYASGLSLKGRDPRGPDADRHRDAGRCRRSADAGGRGD